MVSCFSQKRFEPVHGKCGLATSIPLPCSVRSEPSAQPLLAMGNSGTGSPSATGSDSDLGGAALAIRSARLGVVAITERL